jgi:WD40 repeat protein
MIDLRDQDKSGKFQVQKLIKDADTLIKAILVSPDETVVYTGSTNATIQIWDVAQKELVQQLGSDKSVEVSKDFHKDSIW